MAVEGFMRADARLPDRRFLYREEGLFFVICSFGAKITTLLEHFIISFIEMLRSQNDFE